MARPRLSLGTYGSIRTYEIPNGFRAETKYRDWNGRDSIVKRVGPTKAKAEQALKDALRDRQPTLPGEITRNSTFAEVGERWLERIHRRGVGTTYDRYSGRLRNRINPVLGQLQMFECTTGVFDRYLSSLLDSGLKPATVRTYRTVCSSVMSYAVQMDVLRHNPVREAEPIRGGRKQSRALTAAERVQLLELLDNDRFAREADLPAILRFMLGTGTRLGEALGLRWFRVDLAENVVVIGDNLVRETKQCRWCGRVRADHGKPVRTCPHGGQTWSPHGGGLVLHGGKTQSAFRIIEPPEFVAHMLAFRHPGEGFGTFPVFADPKGQWRDPINTARSIRTFRRRAGLPEWFTSHVLRHTSITMADQAGIQTREISGYHGHARPSFTQDKYMDLRQQSGAVPKAIDSAMRPVREA